MKTSVQRTIVLAMFCLYATSATGVVIGPAPGPDWEADAQLKLGWVFDDPKNPQSTVPLVGWDLSIGATPLWDYDALRTIQGNPAQWYIRLPNVIDTFPVKHFWLSYVYERDNIYVGDRNFTNIEWEPATGFDNFLASEELFDAAGNPTGIEFDAVLARFNITVDMFPNPDYEDLWIGIAGTAPPLGGDGFDLLEVYVMTQSIPEPATVSLMGIGAVLLLVCRRATAG